MYTVVWVITGVVFGIVEAATAALVTLWFSIGAFLAAATAAIGAPFWAQVTVFIVGSALGFLLIRSVWKDKLKPRKEPTNLDRYIGREAIVTQEVNNLRATGEVKINGQLWTAVTFDNDLIIPVSERVVIEKLEGSKLFVKLSQSNNKHDK